MGEELAGDGVFFLIAKLDVENPCFGVEDAQILTGPGTGDGTLAMLFTVPVADHEASGFDDFAAQRGPQRGPQRAAVSRRLVGAGVGPANEQGRCSKCCLPDAGSGHPAPEQPSPEAWGLVGCHRMTESVDRVDSLLGLGQVSGTIDGFDLGTHALEKFLFIDRLGEEIADPELHPVRAGLHVVSCGQ